MEWLLLVGLVVVGTLLVVAMMGLLRFRARTRRMPSWLPMLGIVASAGLFVVSILAGLWLNAVVFGLNMLVFSMLLGMSRRRPDG